MNTRFFAALLLLNGIGGTCVAQGKNIQFRSVNSLGLAEGQFGAGVQLQTINGIQKGSWFAGLGLGLDHYRLQGIPLFADLRKQFGKTGNRIFVYANAGINFADATGGQKENYDCYENKFSNGFYGETGAGYSIKLNGRFSLSLAAGYAYKNTHEQYSDICDFCMIMTYGPPKTVYKNIDLNMLVIKTAIGF
jgi:hypothetical protein